MNRFLHILKLWGVTRILFMLMGLTFIVGAFQSTDLFLGVVGLYLGLKAWFNWGCYGSQGCVVDEQNSNKSLP